MEQIVRGDTHRRSLPASEPPEETQQPVPRRNRGRPKGSRNRKQDGGAAQRPAEASTND